METSQDLDEKAVRAILVTKVTYSGLFFLLLISYIAEFWFRMDDLIWYGPLRWRSTIIPLAFALYLLGVILLIVAMAQVLSLDFKKALWFSIAGCALISVNCFYLFLWFVMLRSRMYVSYYTTAIGWIGLWILNYLLFKYQEIASVARKQKTEEKKAKFEAQTNVVRTCPKCGAEVEQSANFCTNCKHDFSQIPPRKYYTPIYSPQPILENARQAMKMKEKLESNDLFPKFQIAYLVLFVAFVANAFLPFSSEYGMTPRFGYVPYIFGGWIGAVFILLSVLKLRSYQTEKAFNLGVVGCVFVSLLLAYETWLISFREELFFDVGYYLLWGVFFGFVAMLVLIRVLFFVPSFRADYCTQCKKIVTPIRKTSAGEAIFWLCCSGGLGLIIMILLAPKNKCPICFKRKIIKKTLEEVVKYACPKCGDLVYDADEFCSKCGAPLNRSG